MRPADLFLRTTSGWNRLRRLQTAIFAIDGRVRPFNKYLAPELRENPLTGAVWREDRLLSRLTAVLDGDVDQQHALFCDVHDVAREAGYGDVIDEWATRRLLAPGRERLPHVTALGWASVLTPVQVS